jgi:peroxiredoxin Q/BCP
MHDRHIHCCLTMASLASLLAMGCGSRSGGPPKKESSAVSTNSSAPALAERSDLIPVGEVAPDFEATDHQGRNVRLGELLKGGRVVLVFYPKDNTPVCTQQLCALRDDWSKFQERKVAVLGINPAGKDSHAAFASKYGFPFPVVVDQNSRIAAAFGAGGMLFTKRTVRCCLLNAGSCLMTASSPPSTAVERLSRHVRALTRVVRFPVSRLGVQQGVPSSLRTGKHSKTGKVQGGCWYND